MREGVNFMDSRQISITEQIQNIKGKIETAIEKIDDANDVAITYLEKINCCESKKIITVLIMERQLIGTLSDLVDAIIPETESNESMPEKESE